MGVTKTELNIKKQETKNSHVGAKTKLKQTDTISKKNRQGKARQGTSGNGNEFPYYQAGLQCLPIQPLNEISVYRVQCCHMDKIISAGT